MSTVAPGWRRDGEGEWAEQRPVGRTGRGSPQGWRLASPPRGTVVGRPVEEHSGTVDPELQPLASTGEDTTVSGAVPSRSGLQLGSPRLPLYMVWPSQNAFFCCGRLMTSSGHSEDFSSASLCVWLLILAPSSLYFVWVFPHLLSQGSYLWPTATLAVFVATVSLLLATSCTDPGIIPRRRVIFATHRAAELEAVLGYDPLGGVPKGASTDEPHLPPHLEKEGYRWCHTCCIVRPPRSSHCPDCDNCVMRYDHHCPLVNNCVGQRNYLFFVGFLTSVWILAVMVIPSLFWYVSVRTFDPHGQANVDEQVKPQPMMYLLVILGTLLMIAALLALILWLYHVFLITMGKTTKEFRRRIPNLTEEPTLCGARGPKLFDPLALVDPADLA